MEDIIVDQNAVFMPVEYFKYPAKRVGSWMLAITILHLMCRQVVEAVGSRFGDKRQRDKSVGTNEQSLTKNSFQLTNMVINFCLGSYGIYIWFFVLPSDCTDEQKVMGPLSDVMELNTSGCVPSSHLMEVMVAYQLWSIPMSLLVGDPAIMIFHHMCVAGIGMLGCTVLRGSRYFASYFFGVCEISSVFLSAMNAFKARPAWVKKMPGVFMAVKLLFAVSFLLVRVVLWMPPLIDLVRISWQLRTLYLGRGYDFSIHLLSVLGYPPSFFLTMLQLFWSTKIIKGLANLSPKTFESAQELKRTTRQQEDAEKKIKASVAAVKQEVSLAECGQDRRLSSASNSACSHRD